MQIAIDTTPIGMAGGKDYAEMLVEHLLKVDNRNVYLVYVAAGKGEGFPRNAGNLRLAPTSPGWNTLLKRLIWQQLVLPRVLHRDSADLLYTLGGIDIFTAPCKTVIKIGNMAPYHNEVIRAERATERARLLLLRQLTRLSARTADGVITMSKTAEQELVRRVGFPKHKVRGIVHSADLAHLKGSHASLDTYGLADTPFILTVSHLDRYKNLYELVTAYDLMAREVDCAPALVIAGHPRDVSYYGRIARLIKEKNLEGKVQLLGHVPRGSLFQLYDRCSFFVFTSKVEACPRTLVEALKCGTPIACSNRSSMPEICEDAVLYFDPDSPTDIAKQMKELLRSPQLRSELRQRALKQGERFSWEATARRTLRFFEEVIDGTIREHSYT